MAEAAEFFSKSFASMYFFSCVGALILWMKSNAAVRQIHSLGDIVECIFPESERAARITKFVVFVFLGGFIGVLFVTPSTPVQAASAGIAWSRLAAKD
jgi:hypothetical protein